MDPSSAAYEYNCSSLALLPSVATTTTTAAAAAAATSAASTIVEAHCAVLQRAVAEYTRAYLPRHSARALVELKYLSRIFSCMNTPEDVDAALACAQRHVRQLGASVAVAAAAAAASSPPRSSATTADLSLPPFASAARAACKSTAAAAAAALSSRRRRQGALPINGGGGGSSGGASGASLRPPDTHCVAFMVSFDGRDSIARQLGAKLPSGEQLRCLFAAGACATDKFVVCTQNEWIAAVRSATHTAAPYSPLPLTLGAGTADAASTVPIDWAPSLCVLGGARPAATAADGGGGAEWPRWCAQLVYVLHTFFMCPFVALAADEAGRAWVVYARKIAVAHHAGPAGADGVRRAAELASSAVQLHFCPDAPLERAGSLRTLVGPAQPHGQQPHRGATAVSGAAARNGHAFPISDATAGGGGAAAAATTATAAAHDTYRVYGCDGVGVHRLDNCPHGSPQLALASGAAWIANTACPLARLIAQRIHCTAAAAAAVGCEPVARFST